MTEQKTIKLESCEGDALVTSLGGSILEWKYNGQTILGPVRDVVKGDKTVVRGKSHWCFPNFGPAKTDGKWSYPDHGYLRNKVLDIVQTFDNFVKFEIRKPEEREVGSPKVSVALSPTGLSMSLHISNESSEKIPILPAIHPYFKVPSGGLSVTIGENKINSKDVPSSDLLLPNMIFEKKEPVEIPLSGIGKVSMQTTENCTHIVLWSDNSADYICVEPIFGKPGSYGTENGIWLAPNESAEYKVHFKLEREN